MEEKTKFIIIALVGILAISLLINLYTNNLKKTSERERDVLQAENISLINKIEEEQARVVSLKEDLEKISREKQEVKDKEDELKKKYDLVANQKDGLFNKIKELEAKLKGEREKKEARKEPAAAVSLDEDSYWAKVLKDKTELELEVEKLRTELKTLQINNEQLQKGQSGTDLDFKSLDREKEDLEKQLDYAQKSLDGVTTELVREKNAKRYLQDSLKTVKEENSVLRRQLKGVSNNKIRLEKAVMKLQEEKTSLERKFNEMQLFLEDKYSQLGDLKDRLDNISKTEKSSIELPPITVYTQSQTPKQTEVPEANINYRLGSILNINKDSNFVIVDLGEESGLKIGDNLKVYREDQAIANITVVQLRKNIAACDIKNQITSIEIGDLVR